MTFSPFPMFVVAVIVLHSMRYSGKYFENMRIAIETRYTRFSRMLSIVTFTMPFFRFYSIFGLSALQRI